MRQREKPARRKGPKPFVIGMLIGVPVMALSVTAIVGSMSQSKYDRPMRDPVYDRPAYTAHAKAPGDVDFSSSGIAYGTADKMTVIDIALGRNAGWEHKRRSRIRGGGLCRGVYGIRGRNQIPAGIPGYSGASGYSGALDAL